MTTGDPAAWGSPESGSKRLGGRYELGDLLGAGGMAVVRLATDLRLDRTVAVKMLRGELAEAPAFQARFRREARAAASLDHPAVVSVYDAGEETVDGVLASYIVMEYVQGQTLRDLLRTGAVAPRRALEITADVLDALAASHRSGIVHRDIKPANVMVTPSGDVKVMDFGVARAVADMSASLTQTSAVIGTAHYLSPEQARGDAVDARSDVYSTGCLLYELLTGRPPFQGDSAIAVAYQHVREPAQPPSTYAPGLPPEIDAVVLGALAKQPDERYQSADEMRAGLLAVLGDRAAAPPVGAAVGTAVLPQRAAADGAATTTQENPAVGVDDAAGGWRQRRRMVLVAAVVAVLLAAVGGFALSGLGDDPQVGRQADQRTERRDDSDRPGTSPARSEPAPVDVAETASDDLGGDEQGRRAAQRPQRKDDKAEAKETPRDVERAPRIAPESSAEPEPASTPDPEPSPEAEPTPEESASEAPPPESPEPEPEPTPSAEPTPTTASPAAAGVAQ